MIEFEKIVFKNFLSYGNAPTEVYLNTGKILAIGKNGEGKCLEKSTRLDINFQGIDTEEKFIDFMQNREKYK